MQVKGGGSAVYHDDIWKMSFFLFVFQTHTMLSQFTNYILHSACVFIFIFRHFSGKEVTVCFVYGTLYTKKKKKKSRKFFGLRDDT